MAAMPMMPMEPANAVKIVRPFLVIRLLRLRLSAVLKLMPLDTYVDAPVALMDNNGDGDRPAVWDKYEEIVKANEGDKNFELMERFAFYDRARKAYAVIATGETAVYANIILKKGVVK